MAARAAGKSRAPAPPPPSRTRLPADQNCPPFLALSAGMDWVDPSKDRTTYGRLFLFFPSAHIASRYPVPQSGWHIKQLNWLLESVCNVSGINSPKVFCRPTEYVSEQPTQPSLTGKVW